VTLRAVRLLASITAFAALTAVSVAARAEEPWSDADPPAPPARNAIGKEYGLRAAAEYRANGLYINPISVNTAEGRRVSWIEHRLRLDATLDWQEKVRLVVSSDVLDGTLWGDNGYLGGSGPQPNSGTNVNTKNPNGAAPCVTLRSGDPLLPKSYGYGLCSQESVKIRRLYGEVVLPIGLLRIGRQPVNVGSGVQANDGDGRANRFGFARSGNSADRILFATKPLEGLKPASERSKSQTEGFFVVAGYDRLVGDDPQLFADDVHQVFGAVRLLAPEHPWGRDALLAATYVFRWDQQYNTRLNSMGTRAMSRFGDFYAGFDAALNIGTTREISAAYGLISNDPTVDQTVRSVGARAVVRYDRPLYTAYMEFDYASGSDDPTPRHPLTQFTFAEDSNVGLLLFKHVLAFQSARAAAAGINLLKNLGATTYPAEAVNTRGAFTNGMALFPQFDFRPHPKILFRGGALFAWAATPAIDPVDSLRAKRGVYIDNALQNFAGGKPARYYGTELDGRFQWRFEEHFLFDLEGAILFPGQALANIDGDAVRSVLIQGRTTFLF
jgi:hypothetical protein